MADPSSIAPSPRILVVDDDDVTQRAHARVLARAGFDVEGASDGCTAVDLIDRAKEVHQPFAVAVVDFLMEGWNGLDTIEWAWSIDPDLQIIICTGSSVTTDQLAERFGPNAALMLMKKPIDAAELIQAARSLAVKSRLGRKMRHKMRALEDTIRERTKELEDANAKLVAELEWRKQVESEMRIGQRLESVGQLAAGIAHEINTPTQYVGDNIQFVRESMQDLLTFTNQLRAAVRERGTPELIAQVKKIEQSMDLDYMCREIPAAADSMEDGVKRIARIVAALKELSHPGSTEAQPADINRALENALQVTATSYRYLADVDKELAELPQVRCHIAEIGQVFLNLIVNASHAMEGRARGTLGVKTRVDGSDVLISISDTGSGIPEGIRDKIFDAFFTTKEVGRGTGQGLAITRTIITRHGGRLTFDTEVGKGTTFHIRLPIAGAAKPAVAA